MLIKIKNFLPAIILLLIAFVLSLVNYTPGSFLSGWDTLHPEFNFGLNFERTFYGVFRVEQGLGAVAGHSNMADLPRIIFLFLSGFFLPLEFLRYFYVFLCLTLGSLGMYFFLNKHMVKNKSASFLGALFYLLNIGTLQTFNVPFEMFTTLFAGIPFIFYLGSSYLLETHHRAKNLLLFAITTVLISPSAYAATLWYVFFACFLIYFFALSISHKDKEKRSYLRHFGVLTGVFLILNLYWIIPNLYFIVNHGAEVAKANINRLFSEQAFLKNKEFGNLSDLLLLKSFYFDWSIYTGNGRFTDLLFPWINHLKDVKVLLLAYLFGASFILGAIFAYIKLGKKAIPLFLVLFFSLFFLINDNFPFAPIYEFFQNHLPFFKEALRFPDNKILNVYVFLISIFFSFFCLFVLEKLNKHKKTLRNELIIVAIVTSLIVCYMLPAFSGNFINPSMKVNIPDSYFSFFKYLEDEPDIRVANLPIQSPWGWAYYDWDNNEPSFQGAGFLYFGIDRLLDRDFDRWSPHNESYYREMSYAIYSKNHTLLANVLKKYKIGAIFIDKSVIDPQNPKSILFFDESKDLIRKTALVIEEKTFGGIDLFRLNIDQKPISSLNTTLNVFPPTTTTYEDFAYNLSGDYLTSKEANGLIPVYYPFRDLIDNQSKLYSSLLKIEEDKITLIPSQKINNLSANPLSKTISLIPSDLIIEKIGGNLTASIYPNTPVFDNTPSSTPIKAVIDSNPANLLLSFNGKEFFDLSGVKENTPVAVGKIFLKNGVNTISAFDKNAFIPVPNVLSKLDLFFSSCEEQTPPLTILKSNEITIQGKGKICILLPFNFLRSEVGKNILTKLSFNLKTNANVSSCLIDAASQNCELYQEAKKTNDNLSFNYVLLPGQIQNLALKIFIDPKNKTENTYNLSSFSFSYSPSLSDIVLSKDEIGKIFTNLQGVSFDKIVLSKNIIYDPGFNLVEVKNFQNNCPTGADSKKEIVTNDSTKTIEYSSSNGSYCDYFSYPNLPHNQGYLITVYSKNKMGLPMSICVSNNATGKCDIYSDLSVFKSFDKDVFLLPPMGNDVGYSINLENIGINKSPSKNYISKIEFIPIPYEALLNIKSNGNGASGFSGKVVSVTKVNPLFYLATTDGNPVALNLNLSYEKGFRAYDIGCSEGFLCTIKAFLAPIYKKEIGQHVLVNNWSNGWILDSTIKQSSNRTIAIIFVPQYFEYLGFLVIIFVFGALILHHRTKSTN